MLPALFRAEIQKQNLALVQETVGPYLDPYKRTGNQNTSENQAPLDFTAQSFRERLEEYLTDPITYVLMEEPLIFSREKLQGRCLIKKIISINGWRLVLSIR